MFIIADINWLEFKAYTPQHAVAVAWCWLLIIAGIVLGSVFKRRNPPAERLVRGGVACLGLVFWISYSTWWNWNAVDWREGMPLQLCDVAGIVAPLALLTAWRWLRATLYFWGLTLSMQGFLQPVLKVGPNDLEYWGFWFAHLLIVGSALYDVIVGTARGNAPPQPFRPTFSDFGRAVVSSLVYLALILPLNVAAGFNYGYVGNSVPDDTPALVGKLGPWPWRVGVMTAMAICVFLLAWLPWVWVDRRKRRLPA